MMRLGWFLFVLGSTVIAGSVARFAWVTAFDPMSNNSGAGFLFAAGFWVGATLAAFGGAAILKARGIKFPPI